MSDETMTTGERCRCKGCQGPGKCSCCDEPRWNAEDWEDWPVPQPEVLFTMTCISETRYGELLKAEAENARLRERVAVLTEALRTVAECRGAGAWYCKSDVADAALAQAEGKAKP